MGGGSLYDVGCYPVNLARLLLGEPQAVMAQARWTQSEVAHGGVDMALSGLLDYGHTATAPLVSIDCGFDWLPQGMLGRCLVVGTRGQLELENAYLSNVTDFRLTVNGEVRPVAPGNGYAEMVRHFQRATLGQEAALYPLSDAGGQAQVIGALLLSAREGRRVEV